MRGLLWLCPSRCRRPAGAALLARPPLAGAPTRSPILPACPPCSNLAVGGLWPGEPDASTPFPATLTVDYVRVYGKPL